MYISLHVWHGISYCIYCLLLFFTLGCPAICCSLTSYLMVLLLHSVTPLMYCSATTPLFSVQFVGFLNLFCLFCPFVYFPLWILTCFHCVLYWFLLWSPVMMNWDGSLTRFYMLSHTETSILETKNWLIKMTCGRHQVTAVRLKHVTNVAVEPFQQRKDANFWKLKT